MVTHTHKNIQLKILLLLTCFFVPLHLNTQNTPPLKRTQKQDTVVFEFFFNFCFHVTE